MLLGHPLPLSSPSIALGCLQVKVVAIGHLQAVCSQHGKVDRLQRPHSALLCSVGCRLVPGLILCRAVFLAALQQAVRPAAAGFLPGLLDGAGNVFEVKDAGVGLSADSEALHFGLHRLGSEHRVTATLHVRAVA